MRLSLRVQALATSPIRKLTPYADAAKAAGKKVYHLNIGQPDILTPPQYMEAIRKYDAPVIEYGNSKGDPVLIKAIQKYCANLVCYLYLCCAILIIVIITIQHYILGKINHLKHIY